MDLAASIRLRVFAWMLALMASTLVASPGPSPAAQTPAATVSVEAALKRALADEYRARDAYRAVIVRNGEIRPFSNIVQAEERHSAAVVGMPADLGRDEVVEAERLLGYDFQGIGNPIPLAPHIAPHIRRRGRTWQGQIAATPAGLTSERGLPGGARLTERRRWWQDRAGGREGVRQRVEAVTRFPLRCGWVYPAPIAQWARQLFHQFSR